MNVTPNIPRLFTALAEWCACLVFILRAPKRPGMSRPALTVALLAALGVQCVFLEATGTLPVVYWFPCMGVAALIMLGLVWLCCDIRAVPAVYVTARAFLLAELAASLEWQIYYYCANAFHLSGPAPAAAFLIPIYALFFGAIYLAEARRKEPRSPLPDRPSELIIPLAIALASFCVGNLSFVISDSPFSTGIVADIHTIRTLSDLAGVAALFAYHLQRSELYARQELDSIQSILQNQYVQYRQARESIDLINHKYHDLKHQIAYLRAETDPERRSAFLDEMESEIRDYEAQNKTGNPVLDTVLTGKSLYCARHSIALTCVADGALLSFMNVVDLSSLFGNILDNAIECELRIADKSRRLVHLMVYNRKDLLFIQCENYCDDPPALEEDGLPKTTKDDPDRHGYGLKSIRYTAEKYGGSMSINMKDDWFELTVVIPISQTN